MGFVINKLMHKNKMIDLNNSLVFFLLISTLPFLFYFGWMLLNGSVHISNDNNDWGAFGSYLSGVLAPAASFFASYLVYQTLNMSNSQKKLEIMRQGIDRLDGQLFLKLNSEFMNNKYGEEYVGLPFIKVIYALSDGKIEIDEEMKNGIVSFSYNLSSMLLAVDCYINSIVEIQNKDDSIEKLQDVELHYWVERYGPVCARIKKIIGVELEKSLGKEKFDVFCFSNRNR